MEKKENLVLFDWLSFTTKKHTPEELIEALHLTRVPFEDIKGANGYQDRKYFGSISIHHNGREDMGVWCEMSGQGCRTFESVSDMSWTELFEWIRLNECHMTRLDVAFDDHSGVFEMDDVFADTDDGNFISRSNWSQVISTCVYEVKAKSVFVGSPKSLVRVRIYDKAKERHCEPGTHWNRVELMLRDERSSGFLEVLRSGLPIGDAFSGVLLNYLRFVEPDEDDSNKWRWPMTDYWTRLLTMLTPISVYTAPGVEYNLDRATQYVFRQAGNAIDCVVEILGVPEFLHQLKNRDAAPNPKYERLIQEYKYHKNVEGGLQDGKE